MSPKNDFTKNGFTIFKKVLTKEEREHYIKLIDKAFAKSDVHKATFPNGVVCNEDFWRIIDHKNIIKKVKATIDSNIKFLQHNDIHRNFSSSGWHRDSADRAYGIGSDWDISDPYQLVRVGIYLQESKDRKFRLGTIENTHKRKIGLLEKKSFFGKLIRAVEKRVAPLFNWQFTFPFLGKCKYHILEAGDMIIFDPRLYHRGSKAPNPKYSIFLAFGVENKHFRRHTQYYLEERPDLGYKNLPDVLQQQLSNSGLLATSYYGETSLANE